jgi:hypothetical protein
MCGCAAYAAVSPVRIADAGAGLPLAATAGEVVVLAYTLVIAFTMVGDIRRVEETVRRKVTHSVT